MFMTEEQMNEIRKCERYPLLVKAAGYYTRAVEKHGIDSGQVEMAEHVLLILAEQYASNWNKAEEDILYCAGYDC